MLCTILATGLAQDQQATTDDGQKVILKPDFTWKYLKEDSTKVPDRAKIAISNEQNNYDCKYKINEVDEFTNSKKVVLEPSTLIKYTPEGMHKRYGKKYVYLECYASAASVDKTKVIYFNWLFKSKDVYKTFGSISSNSKIIFKFKDGETLEISFAKSDSGDTDYDRSRTTYSSYIVLEDDHLDLLKTKLIDKIRIYWRKGYDNYDAFEPDAFINQLPCIE